MSLSIEDVKKDFFLLELPGKVQAKAFSLQLTRKNATDQIDRIWWKDPEIPKLLKKNEPDHDWLWRKLHGDMTALKGKYSRGWVLETQSDKKIQGAILYTTDAKSVRSVPKGQIKPLIFANYLATAPTNRNRLMKPDLGKFRGVGTILMRIAIAHSYLIGGEGRVSLISVSHPETIEWYERFGFQRTELEGRDTLYYELPEDAAVKHLREMGLS